MSQNEKGLSESIAGSLTNLVFAVVVGLTFADYFVDKDQETRLKKLEAAVAGEPCASPSSAGDAPAAALEKQP